MSSPRRAWPVFPPPSYPEIRLAVAPWFHIAREIESHSVPTRSTSATEGPDRRGDASLLPPAQTAVHDLVSHPLPIEYLNARWPIPLSVSYAWLRRFHGAAARTFVNSNSLQTQLSSRRFGEPAPVAARRESPSCSGP